MCKELAEVLGSLFFGSWFVGGYIYFLPDFNNQIPASIILPMIVTGICIFATGAFIGNYLVNKILKRCVTTENV